VSTLVSSSLLAKICAAAGVQYAETLTGFKWIVRAGEHLPGSRFVFGYEEALGYSIGTVVRDKDGIAAALTFLGLTSDALAQGHRVLDVLDRLEQQHGVHLTSQVSMRMPDPSASLDRLRHGPPDQISGRPIVRTADLGGLVIYTLEGGGRVVVRPSGTEPKLKVYLEVVRPAGSNGLANARQAAATEMDALRHGLPVLLGT
jgi:phosphomannomutase